MMRWVALAATLMIAAIKVNGQNDVHGQVNAPEHHGAEKLVVPIVSQQFADLFHECEYRYTGGVYDDHPFRYRLFVPVIESNRSNKCPLIIWLHGHGEAGSDNVMHLSWLGNLMMLPPWKRERFPFFVLCVHCPVENDLWNGAPTGTDPADRYGSDMISVTDAILADVLAQYPIDQQRIYLSGVSSGGYGAWEYALRRPDRFAAVAPLAGGAVAGDYAGLKDVPVWVFHSTHDTILPVDGARQNAAQLRAAGGHVRLTEIDTVSHDCWTAAFGQYGLLDWMLAQRRGGPIVMDHRSWGQRIKDLLDGWSVPQLIGQAVVIGLLIAGFFTVLKRLQTERWNRWSGRQSSG